MLCVLTVDLLGVSVGQGLWSGAVALVAFVEGLILGGGAPDNLPMLLIGLVLLIGGIVGLALVGGSGTSEDGKASLASLASSMLSAPGKEDAGKDAEGNQAARKIKGYIFAALIGLLAGSVFVPLNQFTDLEGKAQLLYAVPFGIGTVLSAIVLVVGHTVLHKGFGLCEPLGDWQPKKALLPGLVSGLLWNAGNMCSILSQLPPLGMGIGYPLTQCCILVGGLWGILYFKEITGQKTIALFFLCTLVLLSGASLLGIFGS